MIVFTAVSLNSDQFKYNDLEILERFAAIKYTWIYICIHTYKNHILFINIYHRSDNFENSNQSRKEQKNQILFFTVY